MNDDFAVVAERTRRNIIARRLVSAGSDVARARGGRGHRAAGATAAGARGGARHAQRGLPGRVRRVRASVDKIIETTIDD